jgi:hypothetical protein
MKVNGVTTIATAIGVVAVDAFAIGALDAAVVLKSHFALFDIGDRVQHGCFGLSLACEGAPASSKPRTVRPVL